MAVIKIWLIVLIVFAVLGAICLVIADTRYRKVVEYGYWVALAGMIVATGGFIMYAGVK